MQVKVDLKMVIPSRCIKGADQKETLELKKLLDEATQFLRKFKWCQDILESYMGIGIGGVLGVFLFKIAPVRAEVDDWVWVIVGDLPSAYITAEDAPNPACALDGYIGAMHEWVQAIKNKKPVAGLIPVSAPATLANACALEGRLHFLQKEVLVHCSAELRRHAATPKLEVRTGDRRKRSPTRVKVR